MMDDLDEIVKDLAYVCGASTETVRTTLDAINAAYSEKDVEGRSLQPERRK